MNLKEPKKWNHPRLYWSPTANVPLIIIYPNTIPERTGSFFCQEFLSTIKKDNKFEFIPCWYRSSMFGKPNEQRKEMFKHAKSYGFKRFFIGEIK